MVRSVFLEYEGGTGVIGAIDEEMVLVLLAGHEVNPGRVRLFVRRYRHDLIAATGAATRQEEGTMNRGESSPRYPIGTAFGEKVPG